MGFDLRHIFERVLDSKTFVWVGVREKVPANLALLRAKLRMFQKSPMLKDTMNWLKTQVDDQEEMLITDSTGHLVVNKHLKIKMGPG